MRKMLGKRNSGTGNDRATDSRSLPAEAHLGHVLRSSPTIAKAVTYHRVSTRDQDPTLARRELQQAAAVRGYELVDQVEETGSGARSDRPGLARVLELAQRGAVSVVMVWKLDRFGRSMLDVLNNVEQLNAAGVTFVAMTQGLAVGPDAGVMGKLAMVVLAACAELERETISERTVLGLDAARRRGRIIGRPRKLSRADVEQAAALRAAGMTYPAIKAALEERGRGPFQIGTLHTAVHRLQKGRGAAPA